MRKFILIILSFLLLASNCWADSKLSALSNNSSPTTADLAYEVSGGTSYNVTLAQLIALFDTPNVGIGSSAPGATLDIYGTTRILGNGNFGIGTSWPGDALDVQGVIRASSDIKIGSQSVCQLNGTNCPASSGTNYWLLNGSVGIGTYNNVGIGTSTPQGALTVINGNVGIGTWAPAQMLEVLGTVKANNLTAGNMTSAVVVANSSHQLVAASNLTDTAYSTQTFGTLTNPDLCTTNGTSISCTTGIPLTVANGGTNASSAGITAFNNISGYTAAGATGTTSTNLVFSTSPTLLNPTLQGNVGLGTATINGAGLTVNGTSTFNGSVGMGTTTINGAGLTLNPVLTVANGGTNASSASITAFNNITGYTASGATGTTSTNLVFSASPTLTGNISMANVGIGTLTVSGATSTLSFSLNGISYPTTSTADNALVSDGTNVVQKSIGSCSSGSNALTFNTSTHAFGCNTISAGGGTSPWGNSGSLIYPLTNNSNVGIGTSTPQGALVVTNGNVGIGTWSPVNLLDVTGTTNLRALDVTAYGNVGISSATPGALLDVPGTVRFKSMVDSKSIFNNGEYDNGTCTTAATIDPANGTRQKITLTNGDACALTFTQPVVGTSVISLKIIQSAVSSYNGTISGCKWAGGSAMVPTATNAAVDYISVYEDGTNAYCGIVGQAFS